MLLDVGIGGHRVMIGCDIGCKLSPLDYELESAYVYHLTDDNGLKESTADGPPCNDLSTTGQEKKQKR